MEVSGLVSRQIPYFPAAGIDTWSSKGSFSGEVHFPGRNEFGASLRSRRVDMNSGFCDKGHVEYYYSGSRCGGGNKKEKEIKKKLKLLKGLAEHSSSTQISTGLDYKEGSKLISEGAEALLEQLEQVRAEEKEMKKRKKEEKARLKAERMKTMKECESSSSSSSESSESECGEVIDMKNLRGEVPKQAKMEGAALLTQPSLVKALQEDKCCNGTSTSSGSSGSIDLNNASGSSSVMAASGVAKIEVCMGKKCKTSGGPELLEEFERLMGVHGSVVGCKCMGKCKNGPNVRVLNSIDGIESEEGTDDSVRNPTNPLYIGVGLEDVSLIVANLMGELKKDLGLATAT